MASLASILLGLQVNASRGGELRAMLHAKTRWVLDHLEKLGAATLNTSSFPIIEVPLADPDGLDRVGALLFERGIYAQVDELLIVLDELGDRGLLRTSALG